MLQLTSRRFLRELDEAPGGNNLQYILKCPCIPFFGNQGLHNKIMLGGNGRHSRVMCEGSPYRLQSLKLLEAALVLRGCGIEVCVFKEVLHNCNNQDLENLYLRNRTWDFYSNNHLVTTVLRQYLEGRT